MHRFPVDAEYSFRLVLNGHRPNQSEPAHPALFIDGKMIHEFEVDATAVPVANLARMKVIAVHYGGNPQMEPHRQIVAVYKEILKSYKPRNVGFFGTSGGCALAHPTVLWMPELKLPPPGAMGLLSRNQ